MGDKRYTRFKLGLRAVVFAGLIFGSVIGVIAVVGWTFLMAIVDVLVSILKLFSGVN
jgi:hypothetical protein